MFLSAKIHVSKKVVSIILYDSASARKGEKRDKRYLGALTPDGAGQSLDVGSDDHPWPTSHLYTVPPCSDGYFGLPLYRRPFSFSHLGDQGSWELLNRRGLWSLVGNTCRCLGGAEGRGTGSFAAQQDRARSVLLLALRCSVRPALKTVSTPLLYSVSPLKTFDAPNEEKPTTAKLDGEHAARKAQ